MLGAVAGIPRGVGRLGRDVLEALAMGPCRIKIWPPCQRQSVGASQRIKEWRVKKSTSRACGRSSSLLSTTSKKHCGLNWKAGKRKGTVESGAGATRLGAKAQIRALPRIRGKVLALARLRGEGEIGDTVDNVSLPVRQLPRVFYAYIFIDKVGINAGGHDAPHFHSTADGSTHIHCTA